ncbi:MAG: VCBS repeat-containing protein [Planctomycetota bacterium]|nr:VCBS repeat-containing protein [Planctomycetota bacterium]MDA1251494.1 VCBS repeat-containing protein [Planctomycetota bacterium]
MEQPDGEFRWRRHCPLHRRGSRRRCGFPHESVYRNDGGKLPETPTWSIKTSGPAHETVFADIDNDGDLDMAVGCKDQAHIYENLSAGRVKSPK